MGHQHRRQLGGVLMTDEDRMHQMHLGATVSHGPFEVVRVPGGWLYTTYRTFSAGGEYSTEWAVSTVTFVPEPVQTLKKHVTELVQRWRQNADMLAEGNKGEHADPAVGMQRSCTDQLESLLNSKS